MSWLRLAVRDFVIVRSLDLELGPGFTALTGETGAGKSILIDALQLLLGGRAEAHVVREGAARAEVAGEFDVPRAALDWLSEQGFEVAAGEPVLLRRTVDAQGRSRAWIHGSPATAAQLRALGEYLVDIHGQHAWQSLTRADRVRDLLDRYARLDTSALQAAWLDWRSAEAALEAAIAGQATRDAERERLQWQIDEVARLAPGADEWDELNRQHARLAHAQTLIDAAQSALAALDGDEINASGLMGRAIHALRERAHIEPRYAELADVLQQALDQVSDACRDLQHHAAHTELDPAALAALDERLSRWLALARRYRCPPQELHQRWQELAGPPARVATRSRSGCAARQRGAGACRFPGAGAGRLPSAAARCREARRSHHRGDARLGHGRWPLRGAAGAAARAAGQRAGARGVFGRRARGHDARARWAKWPRAVSCRASRSRSRSSPANWVRRRR
jgi:DNA repair protein RecN (Recombination protein N)